MTTRRGFIGLLGAAAPALSVAASVAARAASPALPSVVVPLDDPAIHVIENIWIPMKDGAHLAARLFLPIAAHRGTKPAGAVLEYLPYRKRDGYRYRDDVAGAAFAKDGIAFIRVDIRGTGDSDGVMIDEYLPPEQADCLDLIAWIARQPWCNGHVGMRGISYGSFTALQAAAKAPPALKAIVSACGTEQRYLDDVHYRGGCLIHDQWTWAMEWQVVLRAPPDPALVGAHRWRRIWQERLEASGPLTIGWNEHQTYDAKWQDGSIHDYGAIRAAVFNVAGMLDSYLPSATRMMARAPQVPQKALIGPWAHKWPGYPQPAGHSGEPTEAANGQPGPGVDWLPVECRWWRHFLNGEATGILEEPRIHAYREDRPAGASYPRDTIGAWVSEPTWPSAGIRPSRLMLNADGLSPEARPERRLAHRTNLTIGFANRQSDASGEPATWWREQSGDDALALCFDTPPLDAPRDIMGEPIFHIRVRADRPVAKLCARLTEVTADGRSHFVSYALLNLTHRNSHQHPEPLEPSRDYDVEIVGQFACYRFARGSRIRVAISETWWPVVWPSPAPVTLEITAGASSVILPERDPARVEDALPFTELRNRYDLPGAPPAPYLDRLGGVTVSGPAGQRIFVLEEGITEPEGDPIAGIATLYKEAYHLRRTIREDDPNSAEIEAQAINTYTRGDWKIKLRAWSRGRSTPTHFICDESFEAWEGDRQVFSRSWSKTIPRVLV
jgi:putative CocE/NonD family hydrolase